MEIRFVAAYSIVLLVHLSSSRALAVGNASSVKCIESERLSLLSLKQGFVNHYGNLSSWGNAENQTECCNWRGVSCDNQTGHVVGLDLFDFNLEGTITPSLAELHHLKFLNLSSNHFNLTQFPTFIISLKKLEHLDLSYMNLEGTITPSLAELHHLKYLDLSHNDFNLTQFPTFICSLKKLEHLHLSSTNLKGKIPHELGGLFSLQTLDLSRNQLEGGVPKSLAICSLKELLLFNNYQLSGQLNDFIASFHRCANKSLQYLHLARNRFSGPLPSFSHLLNLQYLYLGYNEFNGTLNHSIGLLLSNLQELSLPHNSLQGVISETHFLRLSQLDYLDLSFNNLSFQIGDDWIPPFQISALYLASCKLGPGFPIWLQTQKSCLRLDISSANISETIPSWFWDLPFQFLNLSHNQFTGEIPNFQLNRDAFRMDFSSNLFEGSIPSCLSYLQMILDLSNNKFTDASSLLCPTTTTKLLALDLSNNQIFGELPECWIYFESLAYLSLANNSLFGKIPTSMGSLTKIRALHLGYNRFTGEIPSFFNKCTELETFDVVQNNFSGLIPSWIGDELKKLRIFILRSNMFFGSLPSTICHLSQVQILDLSMNNISGSLPKCLNQLSTLANKTNSDATIIFDLPYMMFQTYMDIASLVWKGKESKYQSTLGLVKSVDFSSNMLTGKIPNEMMDLVGLVSLNISRNMISGQIPSAIGQLKSLDFLDLSRNHLSGNIPPELSQIDRLSVMDLSYNNLSGEIPLGTQLQSFDPSTYVGNAGLCGAPLPKCPTKPTPDNQNDENYEDDEPFFSRGFFISLSVGFSTGFWGVCCLLVLNQSWRYAYFKLMSDAYDKVYVVVAINMAKLRSRKRVST